MDQVRSPGSLFGLFTDRSSHSKKIKTRKFPLRSKMKYFHHENRNSVIKDCKDGIKLKLSTLNLNTFVSKGM